MIIFHIIIVPYKDQKFDIGTMYVNSYFIAGIDFWNHRHNQDMKLSHHHKIHPGVPLYSHTHPTPHPHHP